MNAQTYHGYTSQQLRKDLMNAMKSRMNTNGHSGRALGNDANMSLWTEKEIQSFFSGLVTAHRLFFKDLDFVSYAHVIICECMQESTGDFRLGRAPTILDLSKDHKSYGLIQVTPASVVRDFRDFGKPICDVLSGRRVIRPGKAASSTIDLSDPFTNIVLHGAYTTCSLACKMSIREHMFRKAWHSVPTASQVQDFGNCLLVWLAGPRNDRHDKGTGAKSFDDYHKRVGDYFVASGFGTRERFDAILSTRLPSISVNDGFYEGVVDAYGQRDEDFLWFHALNDRNTMHGTSYIITSSSKNQ